MAGVRSTLAIFAVFLVFCPIPTSLTSSSGLIYKNYAQIAQHFGFSFPKLPNISFAKISKQCIETVEKLNTSELVYYLDAVGKPQSGLYLGNIGWFGSYSECTKFIVGAHYCLAFVKNPVVKDYPILWGICAPQQCSEEDVTNALQELQDIYKISGVVKLIPQRFDDAAYKPVFCNKKPEYTTGVIVTLVLCGVILFLCLFGTIVDIAVSFAKSNSSALKVSNGLMSVKGVSTAPDQTIPDTERISLLLSSAEVNLKECAILSRHQQEPVLPNVVVRFFLCFSLIQNINRIMDTKVPPSAISSIHGIRVLSMWWVILGHTYFFAKGIPISNLRTFPDVMQRFTFQAVFNGTYSVDSFFFLSGLLVAYLSLGRMEKKKGKLALFQYYFHRFWRLTPTYMFVLLFMHKLGKFLGGGPLWHPEIKEYHCRKYWWTNLLYINNFYPTSFGEQCMGWGWYLAVDMQLYIISPAILFTAYRFRLRGLLVIVGVLMSISFITTAILFAHYDLAVVQFRTSSKPDFSSLVYEKPYCRIAPYLVGMVLGYLLIHSKDWRLPTKAWTYLFNIACWCVAIVLALSTVYGEYKALRNNPEPFSRTENITYGTFSRFAWSLAVAWVVFACHHGLGGLVNTILSAGFWVPLSKLTYCAYLVHPVVMIVLYYSFETVQAYSDVYFAFHFVSFVAMSYGAAFILSLCVECPMMQLAKLIFKKDH